VHDREESSALEARIRLNDLASVARSPRVREHLGLFSDSTIDQPRVRVALASEPLITGTATPPSGSRRDVAQHQLLSSALWPW
jgi:hypothetical protein